MAQGNLPQVEPPEALDELIRKVIGAAIEVHRYLGPGFLESVYGEALEIELRMRGIRVEKQVPVDVLYKGHPVGKGRVDLLVEEKLIVELKAVEALHPIHKAQLISYLKAMRLQMGLLLNFNVPLLKEGGIQRVILS